MGGKNMLKIIWDTITFRYLFISLVNYLLFYLKKRI